MCWRIFVFKVVAFFILLVFPLVVYPQQTRPSPLPAGKLAPALRNAAGQESLKNLRILVTDTLLFDEWHRTNMPSLQIKKSFFHSRTFTVSGINRQIVEQLLGSPYVSFIDVASRKPKDEMALDKADFTVNKISTLSQLIPSLSGEGLGVSIKEKPFDIRDVDFKGRVLPDTLFEQPHSAHATTMATLIAGGGNSAPGGKGVAWKAMLATSGYEELMPDDGNTLVSSNIWVQNHSYGVDIENYYGIEAFAYDQQSSLFPQLLHVFSSGNAGTGTSSSGQYAGIKGLANLTGQFKQSKNTLSVGASDLKGQVAGLSSRGPAYDGRIKPELLAYGEGGTSESAALVSGTALLIQQAYKDQQEGTLPPASLVKAVLINSADDTGRPGPDFDTGFGNLDALGAIQTITDTRYAILALANNQEKALSINVPAGTHELKITLAWQDPEAVANAPAALVHNLDVELVHTISGQRWKPWILHTFPHQDSLQLPAIRGADHLNNVEQITLATPAPGTYQVLVKGYSIAGGEQECSLAYEYSQGFTWIFPAKENTLSANTEHSVRWEWYGPDALALLEYKLAGQEQWKPAAVNISLSGGQVSFTPPDTTAPAQLRIRTENGKSVFTSDPFYLSQPFSLSVGYACNDVLLTWPAIKGISQYQLFGLGENFLEPLLLTSDTMAVLDKAQQQATYFALAPVIDGKIAGLSPAVNYTEAGLTCYIKSFLPRQLVSDTVLLDLEIGSLYALQSIVLERLEGGTYQMVQRIEKPTDLRMLLADNAPMTGRNLYRVKMQTSKREVFYSQPEEVFYLKQGELLLYPNPAATGQEVNILIGESAQATISIYDVLGKLIQQTSEAGIIKTFRADKLKKGTYFIHLQTDKGTNHTGRLVVY